MEKLEICFVSLATYPDKKDGAAKYQWGLMNELRKRGHKITLLTGKWGEGFGNDPDVIALDMPRSRFLWLPKFVRTFGKYLKEHDFDIIQGNAVRGSLPIMYSRKKYLTHIHDVGAFQTRFTVLPGLRYLIRRNARKAEKIMCCADSAAREIAYYTGVPLEKITNVSSAVDERFKPMPAEAEKLREKIAPEGPILFYVGRIAFYKGVDDIIAAYRILKKKIPDLNLIIGGKPTLKMEKTVEKWKKDNPDVLFTGLIPDDMLPVYYSMADFFITYSYASEGFGLTPVEAMKCGTPVICSELPAYKEVLGKYGIFVPPRNPEKLAETVTYYIEHREEAEELVRSASDFLKRYTWEEVGNRVERVYAEYLEESGK